MGYISMVEKAKLSAQRIGCLVVLVILVAIIAVFSLIPPLTLPLSEARQLSCVNNLRQLHTLLKIYESQFGGPEKRLPTESGKAFWVRLTETKPPLIQAEEFEVLLCPASDLSPAP